MVGFVLFRENNFVLIYELGVLSFLEMRLKF
jgi:hypothetical protein